MVSFTRTEYPNERHRDLEHDFVARQLSFVVWFGRTSVRRRRPPVLSRYFS